tara:strand:+ start:216 stop:374 length:159 start_codon:yes stop_codon:yes gene_type:complete
MTTGRDVSHSDVIARLKRAARGDARAFEDMTVRATTTARGAMKCMHACMHES